MSIRKNNKTGIKLAIGVTLFAMALMLFQFFYIGIFLKESAEDESREIATHTAQEIAQSVEVYFRDALTITKTYASNFLVYKQNKLPRATIYKLMNGSLRQSNNFLAIWTMWEPNAYDNNDISFRNDNLHDPKGSFAIAYYYQGKEIETEVNDTSDYFEDFYTLPKKYKKPIILDPFYYQYHGNEKRYFETSLVSPVIDNNQFLGVIGIDIDMYALQAKYNKLKIHKDGYFCLLSNSGKIVTHKYPQYIEQNISDFTKNENISIIDSLKSGKEFSTESISTFTKEKVIRYYFPLNIDYMAAPWYIMIEMPQSKILEKANSLKSISFALLIASLILLIYLFFNITDRRLKEKKLLNYITKLEEAEIELKDHQDNLEELVEERTNEILKLNEELKSSNEELLVVNEHISKQRDELTQTLEQLKNAQDQLIISEKMASLGVLAEGVAHEINNPLNFINGGILAIESYFADNLHDHLNEVTPLIQAIQIGVRRAADIVTSLNHYSRSGNLPYLESSIHLIIDNCLNMLQNQFKHRIEVVKNYTNDPDNLICNEGKLHQAILNILLNASHAIEDKGTITITTKLENGQLNISIADTGIGISDADLPKIMDPFFTTKEPGKGTGLGLSITYNIIQEHNGSIEFESDLGKGTKVLIRLPVEISNTE